MAKFKISGVLAHPVLPYCLGGSGIAIAIACAAFTEDSSSGGGVTLFLEMLSGESSNFLTNISFFAPLGFAFAGGMAAAVNPCGFVMLPAYLGLYLGLQSAPPYRVSSELPGSKFTDALTGKSKTMLMELRQAILVGSAVSLGFLVLFGIAGTLISIGVRAIVGAMPWLGLIVGILLAGGGSWMLAGGRLYTNIPSKTASYIGTPRKVNVHGFFLFGLSYGLASLSCTLPIFLLVIGSTATVSDIPTAAAQLISYAFGMGIVIMGLTVWISLSNGVVGVLSHKITRHVYSLGSWLMVVAGSYIVYYWLTMGGLRSNFGF